MTPTEVIWTYSKKQIEEIFMSIQDREIKEINRNYNMIRVAISSDSPDKFITEESRDRLEDKDLSSVGVGSEEEEKNRNPDLEVKD